MRSLLFASNKLRPLVSYSFMGGTLPEGLTFSRASSAWYFDGTGTLQQASSNAPRFDCDPATGVPKGLLIEEQRTNNIKNSTMVGAAVGGWYLPNYWGSWQNAGLTREVIGLGTEYGMPYIDLRFSGTASNTMCNVTFDSASAAKDEKWTASFFVKLVSGSMSGITSTSIGIDEQQGGTYLTGGSSAFTPTSAIQRIQYSRTLTNASTNVVVSLFKLNVQTGQAIDITVRLYQPQLEKAVGSNAFATSPIVTGSGAVTRAMDSLYTSSIPWFNAGEGSFMVEGMYQGRTNDAQGAVFSDGSNNNTIRNHLQVSDGKPVGAFIISGVDKFSGAGLGNISENSIFKMAQRYKSGNSYFAANGVLDGAGDMGGSTLPSGINRLDLGNRPDGFRPLNGWLRQFRYWNRILTDAELVKVTQ